MKQPIKSHDNRQQKAMNQAQIIAKRQRLNHLLALVLLLLLVWVGVEVFREFKRLTKTTEQLQASTIHLVREVNTITLVHQDSGWQITTPYQQAASAAVVEALLERLQNGCRALSAPPVRDPQFYADIVVDKRSYRIGERNNASDEVYVLQGEKLFLCDKILAAMALAPAINFMDKQLYRGKLRAIVGDFGRLSDFTGMDLSVLEIAPADAKALPQHAVSALQFIADDQRHYQAFLSDDSQHLLLFEPQQSIIYVLAAHPKINAILGL